MCISLMVKNFYITEKIIGIFKIWQSSLSHKKQLWSNLSKRSQIDPKVFFLGGGGGGGGWKILSLVFLGINLKWKLILLLMFHHQSHIWRNSGSQVMGQKCWQPIFRKAWKMKFSFCLQINTKVFYKFIVSLFLGIAEHAQSTQTKFTISLQ